MTDLKLNMWLSKDANLKSIPLQIYEVKKINGTIDGEGDVQGVADTISRKFRNKVLASSIGDFDYPAIAMVSTSPPPKSFRQTNGSEYELTLKDSNLKIDFNSESHRRAIGNIISHAIQAQIRPLLGTKLWQRSARSRRYCEMAPSKVGENTKAGATEYSLFRGFSYRVDVFPNGWVGASADIRSTVLDASTMGDRLRSHGTDAFPEEYKNQYVVAVDRNGKYGVRFIKDIISNETISSYKVKNKLGGEVSVLDSYDGWHPITGNRLRADDFVIKLTTYEEGTGEYYAPASCIYAILNNDELEEDKNIARHLTIPAGERVNDIEGCRQHYLNLDRLAIPGLNLGFSKTLAGPGDFVSGTIELPSLRFGKGTLNPDDLENKGQWRSAKESGVREYGWYRRSTVGSLLIIHPRMGKTELEGFYSDLKAQARKWDEDLPDEPTYLETVNYNDIIKNLDQYQDEFRAAIVVFRDGDEETYRRMKKALRIPSQGVTLRTIRSKTRLIGSGKEQHYKDILLNILSGLLGKSGAIPWILSKPLSCDCFIGVDIGGAESRVWSYAYLFDSVGVYVGSKCGQAIKGESIEKSRFKNSILDALGEYQGGNGPRKIIVHRDGRLTLSEREGLIEAINTLTKDGRLPWDVMVAAVDIKKSHPFRIFEGSEDGYHNPLIGSYFLLDGRRCIINTTGYPVLPAQVTAQPLLLDMDPIMGQFNILDIARDVFYLSELNWGSPKMNIKMPITIRFAEKRINYADKSIEFADEIPL
jgi:hypothetical protein